MKNVFLAIASHKKRNYVTPEDVSRALRTYKRDRVRRDLLAVIGKQTSLDGVEDVSLAAFIAWSGK